MDRPLPEDPNYPPEMPPLKLFQRLFGDQLTIEMTFLPIRPFHPRYRNRVWTNSLVAMCLFFVIQLCNNYLLVHGFYKLLSLLLAPRYLTLLFLLVHYRKMTAILGAAGTMAHIYILKYWFEREFGLQLDVYRDSDFLSIYVSMSVQTVLMYYVPPCVTGDLLMDDVNELYLYMFKDIPFT